MRPLPFRDAAALLGLIAWASGLAPALPAQGVAPFERVLLDDTYYSEGADVGDFDRDGVLDVTSGPFWWEGPDFGVRHEIYLPTPAPLQFFSTHFTSHVHDVDGDGWEDVVAIGLPGADAVWYQNPGAAGQVGHWAKHSLFAGVGAESPLLAQLVDGGAPELVCASGSDLGYLTPDPADSTAPWQFHPILATGLPLTFLHGLGVGDLNGDGRADVLLGGGWLEQPASLIGDPAWTLHLWPFGLIAGSQMFAYDVDGDGDADVVSSVSGHGYGLSWFENQGGAPLAFVEHVIMPSDPAVPAPVQFSQLHALDLVDVDGDGLRDIVTGKTWLAHGGTDPGALDAAVLYWFRLERGVQGVTFVPHLIDDDSGVGRQVVVRDLNGDARPEVIVGSKKGAFVFCRKALWSETNSVQLAAGGTQPLNVDAGLPNAHGAYVIVGSLSGVTPGVWVGAQHVPINPDSYTQFALGALNTQTFAGFAGILGADRRGSAALNVPPGLALPTPLELHHVCLVWNAQGELAFVSHAERLVLE